MALFTKRSLEHYSIFFVKNMYTFKNRISIFLFLSIFLAMDVAAAQEPCQCPSKEKPSMAEAAEKATVIVMGNVQSVKDDPLKPGFSKVEIKPIRKVKGYDEFSPSKIVLYTEKGGCGFDFQVAGDYLIYAEGSLAKLKVNKCGRTTYFDHARAELTKVDELVNYEIVEEEVIEVVEPKPEPKKPRPSGPSHIGEF